jgi:hypothetical protein
VQLLTVKTLQAPQVQPELHHWDPSHVCVHELEEQLHWSTGQSMTIVQLRLLLNSQSGGPLQGPQTQLASQNRVTQLPQDCWSPGMHAPGTLTHRPHLHWFEHSCVPQAPHGCVAPAAHSASLGSTQSVQAPFTQDWVPHRPQLRPIPSQHAPASGDPTSGLPTSGDPASPAPESAGASGPASSCTLPASERDTAASSAGLDASSGSSAASRPGLAASQPGSEASAGGSEASNGGTQTPAEQISP